ncbi:MAG TPA: restriction endonuclease [Polyangiaceae bacterium]|nr:restriction endonuclease [Polyangiaceae bacterium]
MGALYGPLERAVEGKGFTLSEQGKSTLRYFVNKVAVEAGYVHAHDQSRPGWHITASGRAFAEASEEHEQAIDVDTGSETTVPTASAFGDAFELYVLRLLRATYPHYAWYHQGRDKRRERGIDFIGNRIGDAGTEYASIGVQVKFHKATNAPTNEEWLKFLAGCFARRLHSAVFVTTGRLTGEQRREAQEARVVVIEGREEIDRIAERHGVPKFDLAEA